LELTFFGLTPEYRVNLFTQIHEIVFHGKGGYDYNIIYNMPIWLRNFTFHKINEFYEKENKMYEDAKKGNKTTVIDSQGQVKAPEFVKKTKVNYNKEASQK
jgi:hypothetical protein